MTAKGWGLIAIVVSLRESFRRKMMGRNAMLASIVCFLLAIGCNKKAATTSNFESGIDQYFQENPAAYVIDVRLPHNLPGAHPDLDRLVTLGLLTKAPGPLYHAAGETSTTFTYALTQAGGKIASDSKDVLGRWCCTSLRYASKKVVKIV